MSVLKKTLTAWLPPAVVQFGRQLIPAPPMFSGVYTSRADVDDERPWESDARLIFAETELRTALAASRTPQVLVDSLLVPGLLVNLLTSGGRRCAVLDVGGGTGVAYFRLRTSLTHKAAVTWMVVEIGRAHV